ncbi:MAG: hypothetical protein E6G60_15370 [Actinobacteria bacterium]|nr:MAG: hypothetical protein E6G60_15370 [Actinomycetota bacterium]
MVSMPQWLMKTPEMLASDRYFGLQPQGTAPDRVELRRRYWDALRRLQNIQTYYQQSDAMVGGGMPQPNVDVALQYHFRGDWINAKYPADRSGGLFWPQISSDHVIDTVQRGTIGAIHKALGPLNVTTLYSGINISSYVDALFHPYGQDSVSLNKVLPLSTSWVCVADTSSTFFQAEAVRGPSVVELVIATPKPIGNSLLEMIFRRIADKDVVRDEEGPLTWAEALLKLPIQPQPPGPDETTAS